MFKDTPEHLRADTSSEEVGRTPRAGRSQRAKSPVAGPSTAMELDDEGVQDEDIVMATQESGEPMPIVVTLGTPSQSRAASEDLPQTEEEPATPVVAASVDSDATVTDPTPSPRPRAQTSTRGLGPAPMDVDSDATVTDSTPSPRRVNEAPAFESVPATITESQTRGNQSGAAADWTPRPNPAAYQDPDEDDLYEAGPAQQRTAPRGPAAPRESDVAGMVERFETANLLLELARTNSPPAAGAGPAVPPSATSQHGSLNSAAVPAISTSANLPNTSQTLEPSPTATNSPSTLQNLMSIAQSALSMSTPSPPPMSDITLAPSETEDAAAYEGHPEAYGRFSEESGQGPTAAIDPGPDTAETSMIAHPSIGWQHHAWPGMPRVVAPFTEFQTAHLRSIIPEHVREIIQNPPALPALATQGALKTFDAPS